MHLGTRALSGVLALPGPAHVDSCLLAISSRGISRMKPKVLVGAVIIKAVPGTPF